MTRRRPHERATRAVRLATLAACVGCAIAACADGEVGAPPSPTATTADAGRDVPEAGPAPLPRGSRTLGTSIDPLSSSVVADLAAARDAGATTTNVTVAWDALDQPVDAGEGADPDGAPPSALFEPRLHVANLVLSATHTSAVLALEAVDVAGPRLPTDLAGRALDDAAVLERFVRAQAHALAEVPDLALDAYLVATSVDRFVGNDPGRTQAFGTFLARAAAEARAARPGLRVGISVSGDLDDLEARRDRLAPLWTNIDVVAVDYVPTSADGRARPLADVPSDVARLTAALPTDRPVIFREAAYPSSPASGSSATAQAAFVTALFQAWDAHADRISLVTFDLDDRSPDAATTEAARRGQTGSTWGSTLGSLGLRDDVGRSKPAFLTLAREARARGWPGATSP